MTRARKMLSIAVGAGLLLLVWFAGVRKYEEGQAITMAEHRDTADRLAESVIQSRYTPTVELSRQIKDHEIVGTWSAQDVDSCVYMPRIGPCKKRVQLYLTARDLTNHRPLLSVNATWIVFPDLTEEAENGDARNLFARNGSYSKVDEFKSARKFIEHKLLHTNFSFYKTGTTGSLLFDVTLGKPVRSFFLPPMFKHDLSCPNCYFVRYFDYVDGIEYDSVFSINLDTEYIEYIAPVTDTAKGVDTVRIADVDWNDETTARKIVFDAYYPNFQLPNAEKSDIWTFAKSPSCKKCFYVTRRIKQPVDVSSYRTFDCKWEVNIETGVSQPLNSNARTGFHPAGSGPFSRSPQTVNLCASGGAIDGSCDIAVSREIDEYVRKRDGWSAGSLCDGGSEAACEIMEDNEMRMRAPYLRRRLNDEAYYHH